MVDVIWLTIWYVSYVADMYLWVFHGIPFLLHLVLSCTVWYKFRGRSPPRECETASAPWRSRPREQGSHATNEFLVVTKWHQVISSASHLTWCRPLSFKRRSWRRHFQRESTTSTRPPCESLPMKCCYFAQEPEEPQSDDSWKWVCDWFTWLPSQADKLSLKILIEFWAWGGCPQGRLLCFWWYRQMQKQPCFHRSFCSTESCDGKVQGTSRCDGGWPGAHGWSMRALIRLCCVFFISRAALTSKDLVRYVLDLVSLTCKCHVTVCSETNERPQLSKRKRLPRWDVLTPYMYFASHLFSLFDDMCAGCFCRVTIESMFLPTLQNRQVCLDRPISLEE